MTTAFLHWISRQTVALRKALKEHTKDATTIIVAQRISTILNADKIIVLDDGHMAGIGTHEELMKNCEVYRQIAMSQLSEEELAMSRSRDDKRTNGRTRTGACARRKKQKISKVQ